MLQAQDERFPCNCCQQQQTPTHQIEHSLPSHWHVLPQYSKLHDAWHSGRSIIRGEQWAVHVAIDAQYRYPEMLSGFDMMDHTYAWQPWYVNSHLHVSKERARKRYVGWRLWHANAKQWYKHQQTTCALAPRVSSTFNTPSQNSSGTSYNRADKCYVWMMEYLAQQLSEVE